MQCRKKKEAIKEALQAILFSLASNSASTTRLTEIKANETFSLSFEEMKRRGSVKQSNWKEKEIEKKFSTHKEEKKGAKQRELDRCLSWRFSRGYPDLYKEIDGMKSALHCSTEEKKNERQIG